MDTSNSTPKQYTNGDKKYNNMEAISEQDLLVASTLLKDAVSSYNMYFATDTKSVKAYILYNHIGFKVVLYICLWANLLLAIFEDPTVSWISMPYWASMTLEIVFLGFFLFRLIQNFQFDDSARFWKDPKNWVVSITIILTVIDMICYVVWKNIASPEMAMKAVRWSRILRPMFLVNFPEGRQLRKAFRNIRRTLPDMLHVLVLYIASIALFALLAMKIFEKRNLAYPNGRSYFTNYWESFWDLYVLVTTANNPDVMMPAYDNSNWFALLFIVYTIINLYIFINIVLAVIYNNYRSHLKNEVREMVYAKRQLLSRAFELVCEPVGGKRVVTPQKWFTLIAHAYPKRSQTQLELLLRVLDDSGTNLIEKVEFLHVADLLNIELQEVTEVEGVYDRGCPPCYRHRASKQLRRIVTTRYFQWAFDSVILVNAVCIGLGVEASEWFFLVVFTIEIALKMYTLPPRKYFTAFWNVFDFFVIFAAWIVAIVGSATQQGGFRSQILDFLMVLRILRLIRLANSIERFRIVLMTIVNIGPSIATYGGVIFVVYYIYAIIGMETFKDRIDYYGYTNLNETTEFCGNPLLNGSEFYQKKYCSNNFNSIASSFVLLFELMVVNQWHVLSEGYVLVTNKAARLYFITFHMVCVIILLNILTAFVLEVFILEYTASKSPMESTVEARIRDMGFGVAQLEFGDESSVTDSVDLVDNMEEASPGDVVTPAPPPVVPQTSPAASSNIRFKLRKDGSRRVEVLLQMLFEGEIDPSDDGMHRDDRCPSESQA